MERPKIPGRKKTLVKEATNSPILQAPNESKGYGEYNLEGTYNGARPAGFD